MIPPLAAWVAITSSGCPDASLAELGRDQCRDGEDQDQDGLPDCADPDCSTSGSCEHFAPECSDGADNDADGKQDCEDSDCHGLTPCLAVTKACSPIEDRGCLFKLGCFRGEGGESECRPVGEASADGGTGSLCAPPPSPDEESHACPRGHDCDVARSAAEGLCAPVCSKEKECAPGSACRMFDAGVGQCSFPCLPEPLGRGTFGCPHDFVCVAGQALGISAAADGHTYRCVDPRGVAIGLIDSELPCIDPAPDGGAPPPRESGCDPSRLCEGKDFDDLRCRKVCFTLDHHPCDASETCEPLTSTGMEGVNGVLLGVCKSQVKVP